MITTISQLKYYLKSDLFRYMTSTSAKAFIRAWFIPGFRFSFYLRWCQYLSTKKLLFPLYLVIRLILRHYQFKYGISIHHTCEIGPGLYIGHFGGIIVNPNAVIGENCNLAPNMLLGLNYNQATKRFEYPRIGDRVGFGNGCKIIGGVTIGDDAFIATSTVVTKDVPPKAVVVGIPGKIINYNGSSAYVGSLYSPKK